MLTNVHESYQEEDWAKDESTCLSYIHALDQYVFSYETLYSKSLELYALERERNKAKMYILSSINARLQALERNVNVTIGENEKKLNQIFDLERSRQNCVALQEGIRHRGQLTAEQSAEQKRRFVDVEEWKRMYDNERKKSEILRQKVEKARKELLLYHIEHSSSSDSEENDEYLRRQVEEYIESMTAQDFVEEGKIEPLPKFYE
ncbi:hypothetical protein GUITHDRAFT_112429 [Guillardia theta CCMP2712]|uniref:Uncharacterized protein n=1 Tax=Guillardia theta (strain CCMP2712) TaxID=905079 RepID=L1IYW0_GUITC|nr:hypothetical protein GUITHDRAFT_112429 [Guillardia theta CCMP2712]EKX41458.1 hypothetical protein GUITHDRAFT_112429 [Guillardia theta CCMP2712]|eukprot:XP_005828438.1 hypothetical protein GUITHDRAFT_112429 [Guillardia theta CCMP2712]